MGEIKALTIFRRALDSGTMSDADAAHLRSKYGDTVRPGEGQNRNAVAAAARKLVGMKWHAPLEDIRAHRGSWAPVFGPESFSPEYSGWWAFAFGVLFEEEWWAAVGEVWLAANALAAIEPPRVIRLETLRGRSERPLNGHSPWIWGSAPFSQMPGPRFLWADPLNASTLIQRSIVHPCLGLASGRGARITDWKHGNFGLPLAALLGRKAKKPDSWGTVKLDREAAEHLDLLPPLPAAPEAVWFRFQWFDDGTKIVAMSHGRATTRGTVPLSLSRGGEVTYYTAAEDTGHAGIRRACRTEPDHASGRWLLKSSAGTLEVKMPGKPTLDILWDSDGARALGEATGDGRQVGDNPQLIRALVLIDQTIHGAPLEAQSRTGAEVLRRILVNQRGSALSGARTLVSVLEGTSKAPERPDDPRLIEALVLIDQAIRGAPLEGPARTGAEVLRRTLRGDGPSALDGARTLAAILA